MAGAVGTGAKLAADAMEEGMNVAQQGENAAFGIMNRLEKFMSRPFKTVKRLGDLFGLTSQLVLAIIYLVYLFGEDYTRNGRVTVYCSAVQSNDTVAFQDCESFHTMVAMGFVALAPISIRVANMLNISIPIYSVLDGTWCSLIVSASIYAMYLFAHALSHEWTSVWFAGITTAFCVANCNSLMKTRIAGNNNVPDALATGNGILTVAGLGVMVLTIGWSSRNDDVDPAAWFKYQQWAFLVALFLLLIISVMPVINSHASLVEAAQNQQRGYHEYTKLAWVAFLTAFLQWSLVMPYLNGAKL